MVPRWLHRAPGETARALSSTPIESKSLSLSLRIPDLPALMPLHFLCPAQHEWQSHQCWNDDFRFAGRSRVQVINRKSNSDQGSCRRNRTIRSRRGNGTLRRGVVPADALGDFDFVAYTQDSAGGSGAGVLAEDGFVFVQG